jgi:hypothetical protein
LSLATTLVCTGTADEGSDGESRVAKAVLMSAVPSIMVQTEANPGGQPESAFDDLQAQLAANRRSRLGMWSWSGSASSGRGGDRAGPR